MTVRPGLCSGSDSVAMGRNYRRATEAQAGAILGTMWSALGGGAGQRREVGSGDVVTDGPRAEGEGGVLRDFLAQLPHRWGRKPFPRRLQACVMGGNHNYVPKAFVGLCFRSSVHSLTAVCVIAGINILWSLTPTILRAYGDDKKIHLIRFILWHGPYVAD